MNTVFVYGLLKPGFKYHDVVAEFVDELRPAHVKGRLYDAGVPAARFDQTGTIAGYVYWLMPERTNDALKAMDELEDEGEVYRRVTVTAQTSTGPVKAHSYEYLLDLSDAPYAGETWPNR